MTAHLSLEEISALLDGELPPPAELRARYHVGECVSCSASYADAVRLDEALRQPPGLACDEVLELVSASLDGETNQTDQALVQRHLAGCEGCSERSRVWAPLASQIRSLPRLAPSARIDQAIRDLVERPAARRGAGIPAGVRMALAGVATAAVAITVALPPGRATPITFQAPTASERAAAGVQQIVLNPRNNTLYVLDSDGAAVDARDPSTNNVKTRIPVGGRPTALALNEGANTILVLDAGQKRVTEIDAASNTVVSTTTVAFTGTPTSISVGASSTQILVGTTSSTPSNSTAGGALAVLDSSTKHVEAVRETNVAPALVVPDQQSGRTALVSTQDTTVVDSAYNVVAKSVGGVSATFSRQNDNLAVLSAAGADSLVTFAGTNAPIAFVLHGAPRAIASLPDGGFLVLVGTDKGSRVSKITRQGTLAGSVDLAVPGGDLVYDVATNLFAVANAGRVDMAQIPSEVTSVTSPPPSTSAAASPSPEASPSASPTAEPRPSAPVAVVQSSAAPNTAAKTKLVSAGLYSYPLPAGVEPQIVAAHGSRLWFVDNVNGIDVFDTNTRDYYRIAKLDAAARVSFLVAGSEYLFAIDTNAGQIDILSTTQERLVQTYPMSALGSVVAAAVGPDDRLWLALKNAPYLLVFDTKTRRTDSIHLSGGQATALTIDRFGGVWYSDDLRGAIGKWDPATNHLYEVSFRKRGTTTAMVSDRNGTVWLGTTTGDIYGVNGSIASLSLSLERPVTTLATDQTGRAWYLAPLPAGVGGYAFAPVDGSQAARRVPGPAAGLGFSSRGAAFLGDPRGAIYGTVEADLP
jgi:streptogramin lyase/predicted anti-sigma-YlaC factor YlaD